MNLENHRIILLYAAMLTGCAITIIGAMSITRTVQANESDAEVKITGIRLKVRNTSSGAMLTILGVVLITISLLNSPKQTIETRRREIEDTSLLETWLERALQLPEKESREQTRIKILGTNNRMNADGKAISARINFLHIDTDKEIGDLSKEIYGSIKY